MSHLDAEALIEILTEPRNALVKQYQKIFEFESVELEFTDEEGWGGPVPEALDGPIAFDRYRERAHGLGLRVCACLARSWGGEITIDSIEEGTRVRLSLPLSRPAVAQTPRLIEVPQ